MNHYVSTYQKDYTQPHPMRTCQSKPPIPVPMTAKTCTCTDTNQVVKALLDGGEPLDYRTSPTDRLLEPQIYSVRIKKITTIPDTTRFDQPRAKEFEAKCPELCKEKLRTDEITALVEADRWKTTYQMDYSDPAAKRMMQFEKPSKVTDTPDDQCCVPIRITVEADCQPPYHPPCSRRTANYNGLKYEYKRKTGEKTRRDKKCEDEGRHMRLPAWRTEYQDSINKIGQTIMKAKLHHAKNAIIPVWATSN